MTTNKNIPDIVQTVTLDAPIQKVWEKVSCAEGIASWFMKSDIKAEEGRDFTIQSPFGPSPCKVVEVDEPKRLSFQWDVDGWVVTFELRDLENKTEFTLIHTGWNNIETVTKAGEKSAVIREKMNGGWESIVKKKLKQVVEAN